MNKVEIIQNRTVKFINDLKGRVDSVFFAREQLGLEKNNCLCLLTKALQNEDEHNALVAAYDEINRDSSVVECLPKD